MSSTVAARSARGARGVGLALLTQVFLPTGKNAVYAGETYRVEPRLALDWCSGGGLVLAANVGYLVRPRSRVLDAHVDDMVRAGLGLEVPFGLGLSGLAEVDTQLNVLSDKFRRDDAPTEGMLAARFRRAGFLAQIGGGAGLVRGISAPLYRVFAALTYTGPVARDSDGDGVLDERDGCPKRAEDLDAFQDADGCPDLDNDQDGVLDAVDRCPNEAAPDQPDGCPAPQRAVLGADQIQLNEHVAFAKNSARIEPSSAVLLDDIARLLGEHPEITLVRVEGHTDDSGSLAHNRKLSAGRAAAVLRALVQRGVRKARMRSIGLGPERPLVPNDSDEQRAQNRRVELHIVARAP